MAGQRSLDLNKDPDQLKDLGDQIKGCDHDQTLVNAFPQVFFCQFNVEILFIYRYICI